MTRRLDDGAEIERAKQLQGRIFADPSGALPFGDYLPDRMLIFPVNYQFDGDDYAAFAAALGAIGERTYFLSYLESLGDEPAYTWEIDAGDNDGYYAASGSVLENVMYGASGTWGIQCCDDVALVAGEKPFVDVLKQHVEESRRDVASYVALIEQEAGGHPPGWIYGLAAHLGESAGSPATLAPSDS